MAEIRRLGFEPVFDETVFEKLRYLAGPADVRARAIVNAWRDPSIAGLIAVRGGYGSAQVLPFLDRDAARLARKPFIGCSDLTAVLTFLTITSDLAAFHGPMLAGTSSVGAAAYDRASFLAALTRREPMGELTAPGIEVVRPGEAAGVLLGGTLTQLLASLSTPYALRPPPATCCSSTRWGSGPTGSSGW